MATAHRSASGASPAPSSHYDTLGVAANAPAADIKRAYRKLARQFHPDVSKEPDAEARFKQLAVAWETLGDAEARAAYDESLAQARARAAAPRHRAPPRQGGGFSFEDSNPFGADDLDAQAMFDALLRRHGQRAPSPTAGEDQHSTLPISLDEALHGGQRNIHLQSPQWNPHGELTLADKQLSVTIARGSRNGQRLRLAGQGGAGTAGGPPGDLYLEIEIEPHPRYTLSGADLQMNLLLSPWEAALGTELELAGPESLLTLTVPAGSRPGNRLRLKGKGLPEAGKSKPAGDLFVTLQVAWPPADTDTAKAAYAALASQFPDFAPRGAEPRPGPAHAA